VKFLIDNNLSPLLAEALKAAGHDAVHVRDLGMQAAPDEAVLERAHAVGQVLISADTDFGGFLSRSKASSPSVTPRVAARPIPPARAGLRPVLGALLSRPGELAARRGVGCGDSVGILEITAGACVMGLHLFLRLCR
jgi:hypothetical protein